MNNPNPERWATAKRWLEQENGEGRSSEECAAAAERIYERLSQRLSPLIGSLGVQALFARCLKLTTAQLSLRVAAAPATEPSPSPGNLLGDCLRSQEPVAAMEIAIAIFARFFALISTFIGEGLTAKTFRDAGLAIGESVSKETEK